jgi:tRNA-intron endonuclease
MRFEVINSGLAGNLINKMYGSKEANKLFLNDFETLFLLEKNKIESKDLNPKIKLETLKKKLNKKDFLKQYIVYKDLREKGYYVKSGSKFGGSFRAYKDKDDHSLWIISPILNDEKLNIYDFLAKGRVAHSTRKKLLLAIIDNEFEVLYYETNWKKI